MRGNRDRNARPAAQAGSIPASAGEPWRRRTGSVMWRVYPRECGGTGVRPGAARWPEGLSPRVRGNLLRADVRGRRARSIPASAGEPSRSTTPVPPSKVYPRECGGTVLTHTSTRSLDGLSPRVRGNRRHLPDAACGEGSIPASAGEPSRSRTRQSLSRVYPRECGGTSQFAISSGVGGGLSPRVRGNRSRPAIVARRRGSIPASAGEPAPLSAAPEGGRVYPRECGGTPRRPCLAHTVRGLSPRVRGNPPLATRTADRCGSIPASAGEPVGLLSCV